MSALRRDWLIPLGIVLALLILYGLCAPRTVALEDDGLFIMVAWFNGIAHPPGYPLWSLLAHPFAHIPFGPSVAWRVHFLSGVFGSLACGLLWVLARQLGMSRYVAALTALGYGVSLTFWSQAIVAEVYSLHILITIALMNTLVAWRNRALAGDDVHLISTFSALLFGLGLGNHWPMLVLTSPAFLLIAWPALRRKPLELFRLLPWLVLGMFPYAIMVMRSLNDPIISFHGAIDSWQLFEDYFLRRSYSAVDNSPTASWLDKAHYLGFILQQISLQFGPFGFFLLTFGIYDRIKSYLFRSSTMTPALLLGVLGTSLFLVALLNFDYDTFHRALFRVYPITAFAFLAIFMGFGIRRVTLWAQRQEKRRYVLFVMPVLIIVVPFLLHLPSNNKSNFSWADTYGRQLLALPISGSILFVGSDFSVGPVGYLHYVEKVRPDLTLMNDEGLLFNTRLFPSHWSTSEKERILSHFLTVTDKPVYFEGKLSHPYANFNLAILKKVDRSGPEGKEQFSFNSSLISFFLWTSKQPKPNDPWASMLYSSLLGKYAFYFSRIGILDPEFKHASWYRPAMVQLEQHFQANFLRAKILLVDKGAAEAQEALRLLALADLQKGEAMLKEEIAEVELQKGDAFALLGQQETAEQHYRQALILWPHPDAEARRRLNFISIR